MPHKDPEKLKEYKRNYVKKRRKEDPEFKKKNYASRDKWRKENYAQYQKSKVDWNMNNKERVKQKQREKNHENRLKIIDFYSKGTRSCSCCGEKELTFLTIDHIDGGGTQHRKEVPASNLSRWLIKNNFPEGYDILCFNCNCGRYKNGGICPHQVI